MDRLKHILVLFVIWACIDTGLNKVTKFYVNKDIHLTEKQMHLVKSYHNIMLTSENGCSPVKMDDISNSSVCMYLDGQMFYLKQRNSRYVQNFSCRYGGIQKNDDDED